MVLNFVPVLMATYVEQNRDQDQPETPSTMV